MYQLDGDLKHILERRSELNGISIDEFYNMIMCLGLYVEQIDKDGEMWNAMIQFYNGLKGNPVDYVEEGMFIKEGQNE